MRLPKNPSVQFKPHASIREGLRRAGSSMYVQVSDSFGALLGSGLGGGGVDCRLAPAVVDHGGLGSAALLSSAHWDSPAGTAALSPERALQQSQRPDLSPGLTAVHIPTEELGRTAVRLALNWHERQHVVLGTQRRRPRLRTPARSQRRDLAPIVQEQCLRPVDRPGRGVPNEIWE